MPGPLPMLPTELLHEIVLQFVRSVYPIPEDESIGLPIASKPDWKLVEPLTLSNKTFRQFALEAWFEIYVAKRPSDLLQLEICPQVGMRARELCCKDHNRATSEDHHPWDLRNFPGVRKLRLDVDPLDYEYSFRFKNIPASLHELELHDHPLPSPLVMCDIARTFRNLHTLGLSQNSIWCGLCNTCNVASFKAAPPSITYKNGMGLPKHYSQCLAPLEQLHTVLLTVGFDTDGRTTIDTKNDGMWCGECDQCMSFMYADEAFRIEWIERKRDPQLKPPSLNRVEWRFIHLELPVPSVDTILEGLYDSD